jgi:hypothetical protein
VSPDEREKIRKCQMREDLSGIKKNFNRGTEPSGPGGIGKIVLITS